MIRNKKELIKLIAHLSEMKLKQGILYKELALSIESRKDEKTLKEWVAFIKKDSVLSIELKGGLKK